MTADGLVVRRDLVGKAMPRVPTLECAGSRGVAISVLRWYRRIGPAAPLA